MRLVAARDASEAEADKTSWLLSAAGTASLAAPPRTQPTRFVSGLDTTAESAHIRSQAATGRPLSLGQRQQLGDHVAFDFSQIRIHDDASAAAVTAPLQARAVTAGSHIFFAPGAYKPGTPAGQRLLGHELAHAMQQQSSEAVLQCERQEDASPTASARPTTSALASDNELLAMMGQNEQALLMYLWRRSIDKAVIEATLSSAPQRNELPAAEVDQLLVQLVRLRALDLEAQHRASLRASFAPLLAGSQAAAAGRAGDPQLAQLREAARTLTELWQLHREVVASQRQLQHASVSARRRSGAVAEVLAEISQSADHHVPARQLELLRTAFQSAQGGSSGWLFAVGAAEHLLGLRQLQIQELERGLSALYQAFPLFANLQPQEVSAGQYPSDSGLSQAALAALHKTLGHVDKVILSIASEQVDPLGLPRAVALTRERLPPPLQKRLEQLADKHRVMNFATMLGLTLAEAAVALIPVFGPILAGGVFSLQTALQLDELHQAYQQSQADTDPFTGVLGPRRDLKKEALLLAGGVLLRFGLGPLVGRIGAKSDPKLPGEPPGRAITPPGSSDPVTSREPTQRMLDDVGRPSQVLNARSPRGARFQHPPDMVTLRGRPLDLSTLDPSYKYIWVVDEKGNFIYAPQNIYNFDVHPRFFPRGREVKHGDLVPGPGGFSRGEAIIGGELIALENDGVLTGQWELNNNSSYAFNRVEAPQYVGTLGKKRLKAVRALLEHYGTDVSKLVLKSIQDY